MKILNNYHDQNKTSYFALSDLLRSKLGMPLRSMSHWSAVTNRGKQILKCWVCSFEFLDPFYLLFVMFILFQTYWTFPPALDLSPGVGTDQKDERKGSNRRGMEEGRGLEREAGGTAIEMEKIIPSDSVKAPYNGYVFSPRCSSPSPLAPLHHLSFHQHYRYFTIHFHFFN